MSKLLKLLLISFYLLSNHSAQAKSAYRGGAEILNVKAYSLDATASHFSTTSLFDESGIVKQLNPGDEFKMIETDFKLSYGLASNIETSLFFKWRSIKAINFKASANNNGPESAGFEAKYALNPIGKIRYAAGVFYRQTLYKNSVYDTQSAVPTNVIIRGDDGTEYGMGLFATYNNQSLKLDGSLTYVSPPNDLSSEVHYKAEIHYLFTNLALLGGVDGIYSLNRNQLDQKPLMARGPSNIFNSLNRQFMAPYAGINYSFDKWLIRLKGASVVSGKSTDKANIFSLGLSWNLEGITPESVKIDSFKEYHIEGSVLKVSARGNYLKIDQGVSSDVEKGMKFDIYQTDYFGGNELVGSGIIYDVGLDWAVIKLSKKYKEIEVKPGFAARGY